MKSIKKLTGDVEAAAKFLEICGLKPTESANRAIMADVKLYTAETNQYTIHMEGELQHKIQYQVGL